MSDAQNPMDQNGIEETQQAQQTQTAAVEFGALSRWIAAHPRKVLWFIILALIPYILLCWGATFTVMGALLSGGCGS